MPAIITTRYEQLMRVEEARESTIAHLSAASGARGAALAPPSPARQVSDTGGARRKVRRFGEPFNAGNAGNAGIPDLPDIEPVPTIPTDVPTPPTTPPTTPTTAPPAPRRIKQLADFEVLAYPSDGLPRTLATPFFGADTLAALVRVQSGETTPILAITPDNIRESALSLQWDGQQNFLGLSDTLQFAWLTATDEGERAGAGAANATQNAPALSPVDLSGQLAGFTLHRALVPLHFQMENFDPARDPSGEAEQKRGYYHAFRPVVWRAGRGILRSAKAPDGAPIPRQVMDLRGRFKNLPSHWETVVDAAAPRRAANACFIRVRRPTKWCGWKPTIGKKISALKSI